MSRKARKPEKKLAEESAEPATPAEEARRAWGQRDLDGASRALSEVLEDAPAEPEPLLALALVRVRQRALEPAAGLLERARRNADAKAARTADLIALLATATGPDRKALERAGARDAFLAATRELAASVTRDHLDAARRFTEAVRPAVDRALLAARKELAELLTAPAGTEHPDPATRLAPALTEVLAPLVGALAEEAAGPLRGAKAALVEPWPTASARVLWHLFEGRGEDALAHLSEVPEGAPLGLFLILEIAAFLGAGRAAASMARLSDPAASALPARVVLSLVEAAVDRLDVSDAPLELFQALAKLGPQLSEEHRARLGDALFTRGDPGGALALWGTLARPDDRQRRGSALTAEWLGMDEAAIPFWQDLMKRHLFTEPGTPVPAWLPAAVIHLADLLRHAGKTDAVTDLLRRGASRLAGEPTVLTAWIDHLEEQKMERDLERAADAARRLVERRPDQLRLYARALTAAGNHARAFAVLAELLASSDDPAALALFERVVRDRAGRARDPRTALGALEEARAVRPPTAWLSYVEAAVQDAIEPGSGQPVRAAAYARALAEPESAVKIALDVIKTRSAADGLELLSGLPSVRDLPARQAAEITAGFLALDRAEVGARWLADRLAHAASDTARISFLALVAVSLVDAHRRPDLARALGEQAATLEPPDPKLKDALVHLAAPTPDAPRSFELSVHRLERLRRHRDTIDRRRPWLSFPPWEPPPADAPGITLEERLLFALEPAPAPAPPTAADLERVVVDALAELAAGQVGLLSTTPR